VKRGRAGRLERLFYNPPTTPTPTPTHTPQHNCTFDFVQLQQKQLTVANPKTEADKLDRL